MTMITPTHTLTQRPATADEARRIAAAARETSWGCILWIIALLMLVFSGLGALVGLFKGLPLHWAGVGLLAGAMFGIVIAIAHSRQRRSEQRAETDVSVASHVEEIRVRCGKVVELVPALDDVDDPSFCIEIGGGMLLLLRGQWMMDPQALGAPEGWEEPDEGADTANYLPEPYAFPRTEFTLVRALDTGDVLSMDLAGEYLPPRGEEDVLKHEYAMKESVLLRGNLEELRQALERHHDG